MWKANRERPFMRSAEIATFDKNPKSKRLEVTKRDNKPVLSTYTITNTQANIMRTAIFVVTVRACGLLIGCEQQNIDQPINVIYVVQSKQFPCRCGCQDNLMQMTGRLLPTNDISGARLEWIVSVQFN